MERLRNRVTKTAQSIRVLRTTISGTTLLLIALSVGCTSSAKHLAPPSEELRTYEISSNLDGFYYAYCAKTSIFGNCKKFKEILVKFDDKDAMKRLRDKGFILRVRRNL